MSTRSMTMAAAVGLFVLAACASNAADESASSGNVNTPLCGSNAAASAASPVTACPQGFADCNQDPSDGCEANVLSDIARCGACNNPCGTANGTPACANGKCTIACAAGFADCNHGAVDGCEVHVAQDPANCGACGAGCSSANAVPSCVAGACSFACNPGFGNCDGVAANGCETDTTTSNTNCGTCGTVCVSFNGTASCRAGLCTLACAVGFGDCDGNPRNGCETDTRTSSANCGGCGNACAPINGSAFCSASACVLRCNPGFADCDGNAVNGCESTLASDLGNCGSCGNVCGSQNGVAACTSGACSLHCSPGYGNCDGLFSNGCERDLTSDSNNCGACGRACPVPTTCVNNVCR